MLSGPFGHSRNHRQLRPEFRVAFLHLRHERRAVGLRLRQPLLNLGAREPLRPQLVDQLLFRAALALPNGREQVAYLRVGQAADGGAIEAAATAEVLSDVPSLAPARGDGAVGSALAA